MRIILCLLAAALAAASCASDLGAEDGPTSAELAGAWRHTGGAVQPVEDGVIVLRFDGGTLTGEVYCNEINGLVSSTAADFTVADVEVGGQQCSPLLDISAGAFVQTLITANNASIDAGASDAGERQLTLDGELGELVFSFVG